MTRHFTGWHMAAIMIAFFGIVIAVNFVMASYAVRTFGGTVVDNSYVASQYYNDWLEKARLQKERGWDATMSLSKSRNVMLQVSMGQGSLAVSSIKAVATHPLGRAPERALTFEPTGPGLYRSRQPLPSGRWHVLAIVSADAGEARFAQDLAQ